MCMISMINAARQQAVFHAFYPTRAREELGPDRQFDGTHPPISSKFLR